MSAPMIPLLTGIIAWEYLNPVSMFHRGLIFGMVWAWMIIGALFLFDLLIAKHGWCGRLCPMGAFYGLIGSGSILRVSAAARNRCDDCMDCFEICPEPQVIKPALKGAANRVGPVILDRNCTNCGRCIDICPQGVFCFGTRMSNEAPFFQPQMNAKDEIQEALTPNKQFFQNTAVDAREPR